MPKHTNTSALAASKKVGKHKILSIIGVFGLILCLIRIADSPSQGSLSSIMASITQTNLLDDLTLAAEALALNRGTSDSSGEDDNDDDNDDPVIGMDEPLNVIIFYPDDWRHDDLGDANPILKTPTFSRLAKEGIRFTYNAVTTSICWISRASLFSGQYVSSHQSSYLFRPVFAKDENRWKNSWPSVLQRAGYWVGHIGKWQYKDADKYMSKLFNFSSYFEGWILRKTGRGETESIAELAGTEAIRFLRTRPKDRPFAATVAFYPPKGVCDPNDALPNFTALYKNVVHVEDYDRSMAYARLKPFLQNNKTDARLRYLYRFETNGNYQDTLTAQYATISHLDAVTGRIIEELHRQGIYNKTMIIVTADNGEFHGRHALADKWYPYQEAIRVPLIIKDPRMPKKKRGTLNDDFTLNIDLAETILGAAGLDPPEMMQGRDIADLYLDKPKSKEPWRQEFYYEFPQVQWGIPASTALVRKDYKYIDWRLHDAEELFDLKQDPFELNDLANRSEFATLKQEMRQRMIELRHDVFWPYVPETQCDPLWPAGTKLDEKPICSPYLPDKCCNFTETSRRQRV